MDDHPTMRIDEHSGLGIIEPDDCIPLLESTPVGRLGFVHDDHPVVLPVNYRWHEGSIVFRTLEGSKLEAATANRSVAFEVDDWDGRDNTGWSVLVKGHAQPVEEWAEIEILEQIGLVPWNTTMWRPKWARIIPQKITGRRII